MDCGRAAVFIEMPLASLFHAEVKQRVL